LTPKRLRRRREDNTKVGYNGNRFCKRKLDLFDVCKHFFVSAVDNSKSAVTRDCSCGTQDASPKNTGPYGLNISK
jgi:hypothetical protein